MPKDPSIPRDILLYTQNMQKAVAEIEALGGRVTHQFTDKVLVAQLPDGADASGLKQSKTEPPRTLDKMSQLAASAWQAKQAKSRSRTATRGQGLRWDTPGFTPPDPIEEPPTPQKRGVKKKALSRSTGTPTSLVLEGSVAVGVVMVSGNTPDTILTPDVQLQIFQEVQEGLDFLATAEPRAGVSFVYDLRVVPVTVPPGPARKIAADWAGFPTAFASRVDAGVVWNNGKAYFFKGDSYIRYDMKTDATDAGFPKKISGNWPGFPAKFAAGINAGVVWNNGKAYFFKGDEYIRYDMKTDKVDAGFPKKIAGNWPGFPASFAAGIDAVVPWPNGKAYFFKGDEYIGYDMKTDTVDAGYPLKIAGNWPDLSPHFHTGVNAALIWNNGKAYIFKDDVYCSYDVTADKADVNLKSMEHIWRNAALEQMGFPGDDAGSAQYVQSLKSTMGTRWAYVAYFSKYPLHHFAYAIDERLTMNYFNDNWKPEKINQVFAHETCHIFGAADEYAVSNCVCGSENGHFHVPNNNCVNCSKTPVLCLMLNNDLQLCTWSRGQIGWNYGLKKIDAAVLWPTGKGYFFDGNVWSRYDAALDAVDVGFPVLLSKKTWPGWPDSFATGVDAGVVWNNGKAYFFKGSQYLRYDIKADKVDTGWPKKIAGNWAGFPDSFAAGIDAAIAFPNGKAYFFKGDSYVRYDMKADKVEAGWPKKIAGNWTGFPANFTSDLDSAVVWNNNKAYFFKGDSYIRYDIKTDKVDAGPSPILNNWPGLVQWKH